MNSRNDNMILELQQDANPPVCVCILQGGHQSLKIFEEKESRFPGPGKSLKSERGLEIFGI